MIYVKRYSEPISNPTLLREKQRLKEYIEHVQSLNNTNEQNSVQITRRFHHKPIYKLDSNWFMELKNQFSNKCAFCESKLSNNIDGQVDYFRPPNGVRDKNNTSYDMHYIWLVYNWTNLYLCCPKCNARKNNYFPVEGKRAMIFDNVKNEKALIVDPCYDKPEEHLFFDETGTVYGKTEKGKTTIQLFALNRINLIEDRMREAFMIKDILDQYVKYEDIEMLHALIECTYPDKPYIAIKKHIIAQWIRYEINNSTASKILSNSIIIKLINQLFGEYKTIKQLMQKLDIYLEHKIDNTYYNDKDYGDRQIEEIEIHNIRGISFKHRFNTKAKEGSWLMILGENGTGKTTLLQAIVLALVSDWKGLGVKPASFIDQNNNGIIKIKVTDIEKPIELFFNNSGVSHIHNGDIIPIIAYGAIRLIPKKSNDKRERRKIINIRNLFASSTNAYFLGNVSEWIKNENMLQAISSVILDVLPFGDDEKIDIKIESNKIYLIRQENYIEFHQLSSGYQSIISIAIDIMSSIYNEYKSGHLARGIVLIDEIDAHLHPAWKIRIVNQLRKAFPFMQFIVTSHDPLCLRGVNSMEIAVMKRLEERIEVLTDFEIPDPRGLRIDQILTSELFGMDSTIEPEIDELIKKYYYLLNLNKLKLEEKLELEKIQTRLEEPDIKYFGYTNRERMMYKVIDEFIAQRKKQNRSHYELDETTQVELLKIWEMCECGDGNDRD